MYSGQRIFEQKYKMLFELLRMITEILYNRSLCEANENFYRNNPSTFSVRKQCFFQTESGGMPTI